MALGEPLMSSSPCLRFLETLVATSLPVLVYPQACFLALRYPLMHPGQPRILPGVYFSRPSQLVR